MRLTGRHSSITGGEMSLHKDKLESSRRRDELTPYAIDVLWNEIQLGRYLRDMPKNKGGGDKKSEKYHLSNESTSDFGVVDLNDSSKMTVEEIVGSRDNIKVASAETLGVNESTIRRDTIDDSANAEIQQKNDTDIEDVMGTDSANAEPDWVDEGYRRGFFDALKEFRLKQKKIRL